MIPIYLWKVAIVRESTDEIVKEIYLMGKNMLEVSHLANHLLEDHMPEFDNDRVMVASVQKVSGVIISNFECPEVGVVNLFDDDEDDYEYNGSEPIQAAMGMSDEHVVKFNCGQCKDEIRVAGLEWPFIICPTCQLKISRADVHEAGGIYYYEKFVPRKKK